MPLKNVELRRFCAEFVLAQSGNNLPFEDLPTLFDEVRAKFDKRFPYLEPSLPLPEVLAATDLRQFVAKIVLSKAKEQVLPVDTAVTMFDKAVAEFGPRFSMECREHSLAAPSFPSVTPSDKAADQELGGFRTKNTYSKFFTPLPLEYDELAQIQNEALEFDFKDYDEEGVLLRFWDTRPPAERRKAFELGFRSIQKDCILCLECPSTSHPYKSLYSNHLRTKHKMSCEAYRQKYGLDFSVPLSCFSRLSLSKSIRHGKAHEGIIFMRHDEYLIDNFIDTRTATQRYTDFRRGREAISESTIKCLICGREFSLLDREHLLHAHGLSPEEYKMIFGYRQDFYLQGRVYSDRAQQIAMPDEHTG